MSVVPSCMRILAAKIADRKQTNEKQVNQPSKYSETFTFPGSNERRQQKKLPAEDGKEKM